MNEKLKKTIKIIGMGILITVLSTIALYYNLIEPLDPNPFCEIYLGGI